MSSCLLDLTKNRFCLYWSLPLMLSFLFTCPYRLYTISGSLRDPLPPKEAHIEMWDIVTLLLWTFCLCLFLYMTPLRCLCVVVGGLTACVWSHPGTSRIPRDFYLCPGVIFSVDKHDCSVLCSTLFSSITDTLSHMCYWLIVVVQLELELSVLWLKDTRKSRYVKLLHIYCIYFWFCGCLWSPKIPLSVCRSCSLLYAHTCVSHWRHQIAAAHQMLLTLNQQARHLQIEFTG